MYHSSLLHSRIRRRTATEKFSTAAHTPLAAALRTTAAAELAVYDDSVEMKVEGQSHQGSFVTNSIAKVNTRAEAAVSHYSSLHTLSGYLDVGSDALFQTDKTWLQTASQQVVGTPAKTN